MRCQDGHQAAVEESRVEIPGQLTAVYRGGVITEWTFIPSAGYAGYFGPAAINTADDDELEIEAVDGPFWKAIQTHLAHLDSKFTVRWEE